jgi:Holliday junction resolvase RusA-like endonuclease
MKFEIPLNPVTKKNHGQIIMCKGHPIMLPSKPYIEYEKKCKEYMPKLDAPIDYPITLKCTFYMETRRKCDITNLLQAICDIMVKYKVISDDNYNIVASFDGTRVYYDKENPRTIVEITKKEA